MIRTILASLIALNFLQGADLSFNHGEEQKRTHSIQLNSSKSLDYAEKLLTKIPDKYRSGIAIYQIGDYYATRYINIYNASSLPILIDDFKKAGFENPVAFKYNPARTPINKPSGKNNLSTSQTTLPTLSQHDKTRLVLNAQKAYSVRDYSQATIYYEMMVASGINDRQILLNLCYLYGREGSTPQMEKLIEGKRGINDYYYAYGVGALESGRSDLYETLSPQLIFDKSGKLSLLCGYFYEKENNPSRAAAFYKMAYDANPSDPHILYAYARSVDTKGDKDQAIYLYTQLAQIGANFEPLRSASQSRIQEIRRTR